ncbi:polyribonucleotide nucleotidyltransferase, partial [bacterium]|nr:polyribonucleotide nucleotidyltransferase [bacterium]
MTTERKYTFPDLDIEISIGRLADQADGSVLLTQGGTQVLSTVCASESKEFPGFLPLMVDYREQLAAAGKIPGGYLKREGRPSDKEVLTARLIDRSIRPLFPHHYFDQIQVMNTVYSVDQKNEPNLLAMLGASIALTISRVPFLGPVGAVQIGRIDGEFVFNPKYDESEKSDGKIIVVGTADGICMVEGAIDQMNESDFIDALFKAHDLIKEQVVWQEKIAQEIGVPKEAVVADPSWDSLTAQADSFLTEQQLDTVQVEDKAARGVAKKTLKKGFVQLIDGMVDGLEVSTTIIKSAFDEIFKKKLTANMFARNKRIDGRDFDQVRTITSQAPMLVRTHGSAFFQRGGTQALATATLGSGQDEQRMEDLMSGNYEKSFMLHYNFPPFSVGEVRFLRGVSRREVGHGYL